MLAEPTRWSHACGNPVVPSPWQMTCRRTPDHVKSQEVLDVC
jgi:hypothetical protein